MERSKDLFLMMREKEVLTDRFLPTKKEIIKSSKEFAKSVIDSGEVSPEELYSQAVRLKEAINSVESVLKESLPNENFEAFGIKGTFRNGGETLNYKDDEVYRDLEERLKQRAELLKTAYKTGSEFYDSDGVLVPVVSSTPRKSSLSISF